MAEADGELVGNVLISVERTSVSDHVGTLSSAWPTAGARSVSAPPSSRAAQGWARDQGLVKVALGVFPDNERAIAVYEHAGFVREGLRRRQYRVRAAATATSC